MDVDNIVDKFLMEKLEKEIKDASTTAQDLAREYKCKQFPVHKEWQELKDLMKQKKPETRAALKDTIREKLYYLLNLTAEWREQLKKQPLLPVDDISGRLKQVKKYLEEPLKVKDHIEQEQPLKDHIEQEQPSPPKTQPSSPKKKNPEVYRWSCQANVTEIHGFNDKRMIMERLLVNEGTKAIGIVGVAGVGKTALAQLAYNHQKVRKHFLLRIWLCLSKQQKEINDHEDRVKRMMKCLGFEDQVIKSVGLGKGGQKKLQVALRHQLNRGRHLIVLDDVWTIPENEKKVAKEDLDLFSFLTQGPYRCQGTLIVTSRSPELVEMVGPKNMHQLLPLADDDSCWNIFSDAYINASAAGDEERDKQELKKMEEKLKSQIVGKCAGLPLMAKMLGKIGHLQYQT